MHQITHSPVIEQRKAPALRGRLERAALGVGLVFPRIAAAFSAVNLPVSAVTLLGVLTNIVTAERALVLCEGNVQI